MHLGHSETQPCRSSSNAFTLVRGQGMLVRYSIPYLEHRGTFQMLVVQNSVASSAVLYSMQALARRLKNDRVADLQEIS